MDYSNKVGIIHMAHSDDRFCTFEYYTSCPYNRYNLFRTFMNMVLGSLIYIALVIIVIIVIVVLLRFLFGVLLILPATIDHLVDMFLLNIRPI
jgi:hypothetical protein